MANYVFIATSLDGFIATLDGGIDWLNEIPNPDQSDFGYLDFISRVDALVMGRGTFEKVLSFESWPYEIPVIVLSNSLTEVPAHLADNVEIIAGDFDSQLNQLNQKEYANYYIDGGKVIQSFLKADLIDEMIITKVSILLGDGIPLFGKLDRRLKFTHQKTEILNNMLVTSHYVRSR